MPLMNNIHINRALTNISVAMIQSEDNFVADKIFKKIPVDFQSNKYFIYDSQQYLTDDAQKIAPGGEAPLIDLNIKSADAYSCDVIKLADKIPIEILANQDAPLDIEIDSAKLLTQKMLLNKERRFASTFIAPNVWATDIAGAESGDQKKSVTFWNRADSSPIEDIEILKEKMQMDTAQIANTLVLSAPAYRALKNHPEILARIIHRGGDSPAIITKNLIASLFEIDNIFVMNSIYNNGKEGIAGQNQFVAGRSGLLCYVPQNAGLRTPSCGYTFSWTQLMQKMNGGQSVSKIGLGDFGIKQYWDERTSSYFNEAWIAYDQRVVGKSLGIFLENIVE